MNALPKVTTQGAHRRGKFQPRELQIWNDSFLEWFTRIHILFFNNCSGWAVWCIMHEYHWSYIPQRYFIIWPSESCRATALVFGLQHRLITSPSTVTGELQQKCTKGRKRDSVYTHLLWWTIGEQSVGVQRPGKKLSQRNFSNPDQQSQAQKIHLQVH